MSSAASTELERLRFGEFEIQPDAERLLRGGRPIALEPRAFALLLLLVRGGGRLVEMASTFDIFGSGSVTATSSVATD